VVEVSVIIPCRNEERFIVKCLDSIIAQDYPKEKLEVLLVDGMSEDGTRKIVERSYGQYPFIMLLDNPNKITPCALNIGIKHSRGQTIVRMDSHSEYPNQFISKGLEYLERTGADVVGGPIITMLGSDTHIAKCIAMATSHRFGVGNSKFRTSIKEGYVDTVPFGFYRKNIFNKVGLFDERLPRNQDNELSSRIIKSGGRIYITPDLTVKYYNQSTITGLLRQALMTGMWNVVTLKINPAAFRWRHFIPFVFVMSFLITFIFAFFQPWAKSVFLAISGLYAFAAIISSFQIGLREGLKYFYFMPVMFFFYHFSYGLGTLLGVIRFISTGWYRTENTTEKI
jgi:glycosyltransferase involved in cell wall biosynthesis